MKALKLRILIVSFLFALPFGVGASGSSSSSESNAQKSQDAKQEKTETDDQGESRGFDPCLLNPSLAVCANKQ